MSKCEAQRLEEVFSDPAVREFGSALRRALRLKNDYASLMDLNSLKRLKPLLMHCDGFCGDTKP